MRIDNSSLQLTSLSNRRESVKVRKQEEGAVTGFSTLLATKTGETKSTDTLAELKQRSIMSLLEWLFSERFKLHSSEKSFFEGYFNSEQFLQIPTYSASVIHVEQSVTKEVYEETSFTAAGQVRTSDGRVIDFDLNLTMSASFVQSYTREYDLAEVIEYCDPLVINMDVPAASVSDQTFLFDLDADGATEEISMLCRGSGYLTLDKNEDGAINDGSELFGAASGNGFADLAVYDEDGNGWIDENDSIFEKLRIWSLGDDGEMKLYTLKDGDIGAICLQNVPTSFAHYGSSGQINAMTRSSGFYLRESGGIGTVQHLDMAL